MVGTLKRQAAAAGAHVELKVKQVRVQTAQRRAEGLPVPVDVQFDIDVIGKKWIFSKVAKKLAGRAQFLVAGSSRIVGIEGNIE
jgi:long-subunit acyl-CoA synthetase (AMP-forming)